MNHLYATIAGTLAFLIFGLDSLVKSEFDFSVLYIVPVLLSSLTRGRSVVLVAAFCTLLTCIGWGAAIRRDIVAAHHPYRGFSIASIWCVALLANQLPRLRTRRFELQSQLQATSMELEASEEKMRLITASALDAVVTIDEAGLVTRWNCQAEATFGWKFDEVKGRLLSDLIVPEVLRDTHRRGIEHFMKSGEGPVLNKRIEMEALRHDGETFPIELSVVALRLRDGVEYCVFARDISESQQILLDLQDRELRNRVLLNSTAEGIYGLDMEGRCTFANPACATMLGYDSPEEFLGHNMHKLIHHKRPDGSPYPQESCHIFQAFRTGSGVQANDEVFWRKDDTPVPVDYWSYPVQVDGELTGSVVTFVDISKRRVHEFKNQQTNEQLRSVVREQSADLEATREQLELALTGANVGLWDWNPQTSKVYYSPTFKTQLGYPPEVEWDSFEVWETRLHPDDHAKALATVESYFARTSEDYKSIFRLQCKDGSYRSILAQGKAVFDEHGQPLRMTGVHVDITEQVAIERELKRVNEALADANELLLESNVELQQFAYVASHDLQSPLRAIAGFAQFLEKDYANELDERACDYVNRIVGGVKRMQRMINDLLAYSRVETRAAAFQAVSLNDVFQDSVELLEAFIFDSNAIVTRSELPEVVGDPSQISQLLTNLVGNAIKYNRNRPCVEVTASRQEPGWILCVDDNGIGIDEKHHAKIFEVFRRLHTRDEYAGTGIGLAICRRIAKRHGWKIYVTSKPEGGTRFSIQIPDSEIRDDNPSFSNECEV